jgi:mono/diheme cytochrome c family protein
MSPVRAVLAVGVVAAMGCAILGIGTGPAPAGREPGATAVAASRERIVAGGASVRRGRRLFAAQGCDRCHAIAAIGAEGKLGPRLDTVDDGLDDNLESIVQPRRDITDGYPSQLMPSDFDERLAGVELQALAAFVTAASGGADKGGQGRGRGRGHGRGRD